MKRYTFLFLFFVSFFSCKKEAEFLIFSGGDMKTGRADGYRDGHTWTATARASCNKEKTKIGLFLTTYTVEGVLKENFTFYTFPYSVGRTIIKNEFSTDATHVGSRYCIMEEDELTSPIYSDIGEDAYLEITKLDIINQIVEGKIAKLVLEPIKNDVKSAPRCVVFKNCTFSAKID